MSHTLNRRGLLAGAAALAGARFATPALAQPAPILIGQSLPLSGPVAPALAPIVQGQNLALEQLNRKGASPAGRCSSCNWTTHTTRAAPWRTCTR